MKYVAQLVTLVLLGAGLIFPAQSSLAQDSNSSCGSFCGDGVCSFAETSATCPADCGVLLVEADQQPGCYAHVEPIGIGERGQVKPGFFNRIRSGAGLSHDQIGSARSGVSFDVVGGPVCADGYWWWQIDYQGTVGWTAEGTSQGNWIERTGE